MLDIGITSRSASSAKAIVFEGATLSLPVFYRSNLWHGSSNFIYNIKSSFSFISNSKSSSSLIPNCMLQVLQSVITF